jgi:NADH:ubiquinone oxidoreductase subunit 3 (subunit A)
MEKSLTMYIPLVIFAIVIVALFVGALVVRKKL